jgi:hypothetical protein
VIGVCIMMRWIFAGAVVVSAVVGGAAAARGVSLIVSGFYLRTKQFAGKRKQASLREVGPEMLYVTLIAERPLR